MSKLNFMKQATEISIPLDREISVRNKLSKLSSCTGRSVPIESRDQGLSDSDIAVLRQQHGFNEVIAKRHPEWLKAINRYLNLVPVILFAAAILSVAVADKNGKRDWLSFGLLVFLVNAMVWADYFSDRNSRNAIKAVEALSTPVCRCKRNGVFVIVPVRELLPGDVVSLKAGVVIPADGVLVSDEAVLGIDESALTGECLPVTKRLGDDLLSGAVVQKGESVMTVTKIGANSFFGKTLALLGTVNSAGNLRIQLDRAALIITGISTLFATFLFFWLLVAKRSPWYEALKLAFVIVASVAPAAMPVVTTTVLAVGAIDLSREKTIVNRLSSIEEAAGIEILCCDKTGTLTKNVLTLNRDEIVCEKDVTPSYLLLMASLAGSIEDPEPIDRAIHENTDLHLRRNYDILKYIPFNPVDKRTVSHVYDKISDDYFYVVKGAPHVVMNLICETDSNEYRRIKKIIDEKAVKGLRTLCVAMCENSDCIHNIDDPSEVEKMNWKLLGYICLYDPPREDTAETIRKAMELGIDVKIITGDQQAIAIETARQLKMGVNISGPEVWDLPRDGPFLGEKSFSDYVLKVNGFAGVYPEHKFNVVESILKARKLVGMTGDGVNDAPALKLATVGIAVAGATEAAKSAADIILLAEGLSPIITALKLSRQIFRRVEAYIIFRIFTSILILLFYFFMIVFFDYLFPTWTLVLISIINDFTLVFTARDRVPSTPFPQIWRMLKITLIALWVSLLTLSSVILYYCLICPTYIDWWPRWGIKSFDKSNPNPQISATLWWLLTLFVQFMFHSVRTDSFFCNYSYDSALFPSLIVLIPQIVSILLTLFLSVYWNLSWRPGSGEPMVGTGWKVSLVTTFWAVIWFLLIDALKIMAYRMSELKWSDMNLVKIFTPFAPSKERRKLLAELKRLQNIELHRRLDENEISVADKITESRRSVWGRKSPKRVASYAPEDNLRTTESDTRNLNKVFTDRLEAQARQIVHLEARLDSIESKLLNCIASIEKKQ